MVSAHGALWCLPMVPYVPAFTTFISYFYQLSQLLLATLTTFISYFYQLCPAIGHYQLLQQIILDVIYKRFKDESLVLRRFKDELMLYRAF